MSGVAERLVELMAMTPWTYEGWVRAMRKAINDPMEIPTNTADGI